MKEQELIPYTCNFEDLRPKNVPSVTDNNVDIFRNQPPDRVRRVAMAVPRYALAIGEQRKDIARLYELEIDFLDKITKDTYVYKKH